MGNYYTSISMIDRFWPKVSMAGPDECWEWKASTKNGYGRIRAEADKTGKTIYAHRASWAIHNGPVPSGMYVCHRCDNRKCVNPAHLFLGTDSDNTVDMYQKGRHPRAKLAPDQVLKIRADSRPYKFIAADYGVSEVTVSQVKTRAVWAHI